MGLNILDDEYAGQPSLYANAGEWIEGAVKVGNFFSAGSGNSNKFTVVNNSIELQNGEWGDYGFTEGMAITIEFTDYNLPPPFNPVIFNKTITFINGDLLFMDTALAGYPSVIFPTNNSVSGMLLYADVSPDALDFYFNLSPNGTVSTGSILDNQVNRFEIQELALLGVAASAPMVQVNNKSGGWVKDVIITRDPDTPPLQFGGTPNLIQRNYTITYKFIQWGLLQDGFDPPNYYNAADDLVPVINIDTFGLYGNPNSIQSTQNGAQEANTGYFDENYNGGVASYTKNSISWVDLNGDPIDKMDYSNYSDFIAIIDAPNQDIAQSIYRLGLAFLPTDAAEYQNLPTDAGQNLLINAPDQDYQHAAAPDPAIKTGGENSAGARFDIQNIQFENIGGNQIRVSGRVIPNNTSDETINYFSPFPNGERRMIIWAQVGNYQLANQYSDQVNVLLYDDDNYDAPTIGVQIPTVISEEILDHGGIDITSTAYPNTTTEDDVLYRSDFTLPDGIEYDGLRANISAYNTATGEAFTLEEYYIDFANQPFINGIHEISNLIPRNFLLAPASDRNAITLMRKPSIDGVGFYGLELNYGWLNSWQYWIAQANANTDFFNAAQANNGLNKDWQHYDLSSSGDWIIRLSYYTRLNGVDDFNHKQIKIRPYEDDPTVSVAKTFTVLSDGSTPNQLISNELIEISGAFTWNNAFNGEWAEIAVENYEGARIGYISSVLDSGQGVLQATAGNTKLETTLIAPNVLGFKCLIDTNGINVDLVSLTYRVFSLPKDEDAVNGKQMADTGFFKTTTGGLTKQKAI